MIALLIVMVAPLLWLYFVVIFIIIEMAFWKNEKQISSDKLLPMIILSFF